MSDKYDKAFAAAMPDAHRHPGYTRHAEEVVQSSFLMATAFGDSDGNVRTRDQVRKECRRSVAKMYGIPVGTIALWMLLTVVGRFVGWYVERLLDEWFPRETGRCSD